MFSSNKLGLMVKTREDGLIILNTVYLRASQFTEIINRMKTEESTRRYLEESILQLEEVYESLHGRKFLKLGKNDDYFLSFVLIW